MMRNRLVVVLTVAGFFFVASGHTQEKKVAMSPVSYDGLKQEVLKYRGKVLIVDFWASYCVPCQVKGFPHMMELHKKYANDGLAVVTVSVDDPENPDAIQSANAFLNKKKPPFDHVHLTDPTWSKRLGIGAVPCYYVFDRSGRWVRFGGDTAGVDYEKFDKTIAQMLAEK